MKRKILTVLALLITTACGESSSKGPLVIKLGESPIWNGDSAIPSWFLKMGRYSSLCLQPHNFPGAVEVAENKDRFSVAIEVTANKISLQTKYFKDSNCKTLDRVRTFEADLDTIYQADNPGYIAYYSKQSVRITEDSSLLTEEEARVLNAYNVCGGEWKADHLNDVSQRNKEVCQSEVDRIESGGSNRSDGITAQLALMHLFNYYSLPEMLHLVAKQQDYGILVRSIPGDLEFENQEIPFFRVEPALQ